MHQLSKALSFLLFILVISQGCNKSNPPTSAQDQEFDPKELQHKIEVIEERAQLQRQEPIITYLADYYKPPSPKIGDPEKYYWPIVIARFKKYGNNDKIANEYVELFHKNPPFHFTLLGQVRIMGLYPNAPMVKKYWNDYIRMALERTDRYNPFTSEGTENHNNMARASGYLIAQWAEKIPEFKEEGTKRKKEMRTWLQHYAKTLFANGNGEWNSSSYGPYNISPFLNLYDFAEDEEVRKIARAILDYYSVETALFYHDGMVAGPEMRGGVKLMPLSNNVHSLAWLWFNISNDEIIFEDTVKVLPKFNVLATIHAATSSYRPHRAARKLAVKNFMSRSYYRLSRPDYLRSKGGYIPILYYTNEEFTLGSAQLPFGGWSGGDSQIVPWKLTAASDSIVPGGYLMSGGGRYFKSSGGRTRDPYMQLAQYQNVLIQMHRIPKNHEELYENAQKIIEEWQEKWKADFLVRFPGETIHKNPVTRLDPVLAENMGYVEFNTFQNVVFKVGKFFLDWEDTYIAVHLLYNREEIPSISKKKKHGQYQIVDDCKNNGAICGFVLETKPKSNYKDFNDFIAQIISKTSLEVKSQNNSVTYVNLENDTIQAFYSTSGTYTEPIYDWGFGPKKALIIASSPTFMQPTWPEGEGNGRVAKWKVNGEWHYNGQQDWPVGLGPDYTHQDSKLFLAGDRDSLQIDFSGELPIYK